ncbi:MAG: hypothetical protein ACPF9K_14900, partial [Neptuniibacter sp.]
VANMVHVIDVETQEIVQDIVVGNRPRRMELTPDLSELWVSNEVGGTITILDTATYQPKAELKFAPKGMRPESISPVGMAMTKDGKQAYITLGGANHVAVVDTATHKVLDYILVGKRAWGISLNKDESRLYVTNGKSDDLAVIDTAKMKVIKSVPAGRVPHDVVVDH